MRGGEEYVCPLFMGFRHFKVWEVGRCKLPSPNLHTVESAYSGHGYSGHPLIVVNFESPDFFLQFSSKNRPLTVVKNPLIVVNFKNFRFKSDDF